MPDVSRSDSNRSDISRPRVSFNRNVHVKRINAPKISNAYSLSPDGTGLIPTSVRRERVLTKKDMTEEAEEVLKQVDKVNCLATSNVKLENEKPKNKKKKKDSFLFKKKGTDKHSEKIKHSSSDVDSGSSQEYRIYRVNSPMKTSNNSPPLKSNIKANIVRENSRDKYNKKTYDFFSLDRKRLKKQENESLDYLSLEGSNYILKKTKKEKHNKAPVSTLFDNKDVKNIKTPIERKESVKIQSKDSLNMVEKNRISTKKVHLPSTDNPAMQFSGKKKENNVDRMVKKLSESNCSKLTKNTGKSAMKEPKSDTCHNDNRPFSYTNREKSDLELKLGPKIVEDLGNCKDLKTTSPTNDVIYAQVIIGGRDGNAQRATVNERVASNEVGRFFVGENLRRSPVGLNYKTDAGQNGGDTYERVIVDSDETWQANGDICDEKSEKLEFFNIPSYKQYENNQEDSEKMIHITRNENENISSSPIRDEYTKVIKVSLNHDSSELENRSPTDLHDLSIRREILLSRSESQAKERFNSLRKLHEPARLKRNISNLNENRPDYKTSYQPIRSDVWPTKDDSKANEKIANNIRKPLKDVEIVEPKVRKKKESKLDYFLNGKEVHVIQTNDEDNILRKLSRLGKSKSFIQDKPKSKGMEKMKNLFKKKKDEKSPESEEDPLPARYTEYRGSDLDLSDRSTDSLPKRSISRTEATPTKTSYFGRSQLSTPTTTNSMGRLVGIKNEKNKNYNEPQSLKRPDKKEKQKRKLDEPSNEASVFSKPTNLKFFGDTDQESNANESYMSDLKTKHNFNRSEKLTDSDEELLFDSNRPDSRMTNSTLRNNHPKKYKSKCDLDKVDYGIKQMNHGLQMTFGKPDNQPLNQNETSTLKKVSNDAKNKPEVFRSKSSLGKTPKSGTKEKLRNLKSTPVITLTSPSEPLSRKVLSQGSLYSTDERKGGRRKLYDSSAESATEGDSSQHSTKSMIYLHAATVGDIPRPRNIYKSDGRSQSKEELNSMINNSLVSPPSKKTLSRSFSVLAPWRPKHNKEDRTLYYNSVDHTKGKPPTGAGKNKKSLSKEKEINEIRFNTIGKENRRRKDLLR